MAVPVYHFTAGVEHVEVHPTSEEAGRAAASGAAEALREAVRLRGHARAILATGNSQLTFVRALRDQDIPWHAISVFHMDEYIGIDHDHPASFRRWIRSRITDPFSPADVQTIDGQATDVEAECARYERLLRAAPIDLTCMGIGENGHLAFNEPGEADFADPRWVRRVRLTDESVAQQVGEGHFKTIADVPQTAISLTIPALLSAARVQVLAPERRKATAVLQALTGAIGTDCPATVLREHAQAWLYLDTESAAELSAVPG